MRDLSKQTNSREAIEVEVQKGDALMDCDDENGAVAFWNISPSIMILSGIDLKRHIGRWRHSKRLFASGSVEPGQHWCSRGIKAGIWSGTVDSRMFFWLENLTWCEIEEASRNYFRWTRFPQWISFYPTIQTRVSYYTLGTAFLT